MDNDDRQLGCILSRREVLALFGAAGAAILTGCGTGGSATPAATAGGATPGLNAEAATAAAMEGDPTARAAASVEVATAEAASTAVAMPACVVRPEATEGPYYVDEDLVRSDIREDREGAPLTLTFNVSRVSGASCAALEGAEVEIWHCDAEGAYSGVSDPGFSTEGQRWLRGSQVTGADGKATFTTIYPGWYGGRAVHIHFKVRPSQDTVFTSQLFFDEELTDRAHAREPYAGKGRRDTLNSTDNIYQDLLLLTATETDQGYAAVFPIGVDQ